MHERVRSQLARTNNAVEEWHNAFQSGIVCCHPSISKLLKFLQREKSLQEARLAKWEAGVTNFQKKKSIELNERPKHSFQITGIGIL